MSSPSERFECQWRPSGLLLVAYLLAQALAWCVLFFALAIPAGHKLPGLLGCLLHAAWVLPGAILHSGAHGWVGLRRDSSGWQLQRRNGRWQPVQLRPDTLAWPGLIILRYRLPGYWFTRSLCLPADSLAPASHRRLRLRLKFSRRRWAAV